MSRNCSRYLPHLTLPKNLSCCDSKDNMENTVDNTKSIDNFAAIIRTKNSSNVLIRQADNWYATKKSIRHEMLNLSLLAVNSANLRHSLTRREENKYYWVGIFCIIFSIVLQVFSLQEDVYLKDILVHLYVCTFSVRFKIRILSGYFQFSTYVYIYFLHRSLLDVLMSTLVATICMIINVVVLWED